LLQALFGVASDGEKISYEASKDLQLVNAKLQTRFCYKIPMCIKGAKICYQPSKDLQLLK
jgi:hypothetical protein